MLTLVDASSRLAHKPTA